MFLTKLLLILHLASVFALVGGVVLHWVGARSLTVAAVPEEVDWASRLITRNGAMLVRIGGIAALVFGVLLAWRKHESLGAGWLGASFLAWILLLGISEGFTGRTMRKLGATANASDGTPDGVRVGSLRMSTSIEVVLLVVLLVLMVWRPGGG